MKLGGEVGVALIVDIHSVKGFNYNSILGFIISCNYFFCYYLDTIWTFSKTSKSVLLNLAVLRVRSC